MGGSPEQAEQRRVKVIELLGQGFTEREIANQLEVAEVTIWKDMQALRTDPTWFKNYIHDLFQRALNSLDLKDPQDRRCFFNNICHLVGKTMPQNVTLSGSVEQHIVMVKGEFCKVGADGKPTPINPDAAVPSKPEATPVSQ